MGVAGSLLDRGAAVEPTSPEGEPGQTHYKRQAVRSNRSQAATPVVIIWAKQAAEEPVWPVIPRSPPFLLADDEESRTALKILRARFLEEFTLSQLRRFFASLRMTAWGGARSLYSGHRHYPSRPRSRRTASEMVSSRSGRAEGSAGATLSRTLSPSPGARKRLDSTPCCLVYNS